MDIDENHVREDRLGGVNPPPNHQYYYVYLGGVNRGDRLTQQYYYIWGGLPPPSGRASRSTYYGGLTGGRQYYHSLWSKGRRWSVGHGRWEIQRTTLGYPPTASTATGG